MQPPSSRAIDAHHHYWWYGQRTHQWPAAAGGRLDRDFTPDDLLPQMRAAGVDAGLLMQSLNDHDETVAFLALAAASPHIAGVVGWLPLAQPGLTAARLEALPHRELLVGARHLINFEPDPAWLARPEVRESVAMLAGSGLVFDAVPVNPVQFDCVLAVAERHPAMPVVLDHLARPPVGQADAGAWAARIRRAAALPNVAIKLSVGLDVVLGWEWSVAQLRPHAETVLDHFGPGRVMAASNWPVSTLAADYTTTWAGLRALIAGLPLQDQAAVLGGNARRIFKLRK